MSPQLAIELPVWWQNSGTLVTDWSNMWPSMRQGFCTWWDVACSYVNLVRRLKSMGSMIGYMLVCCASCPKAGQRGSPPPYFLSQWLTHAWAKVRWCAATYMAKYKQVGSTPLAKPMTAWERLISADQTHLHELFWPTVVENIAKPYYSYHNLWFTCQACPHCLLMFELSVCSVDVNMNWQERRVRTSGPEIVLLIELHADVSTRSKRVIEDLSCKPQPGISQTTNDLAECFTNSVAQTTLSFALGLGTGYLPTRVMCTKWHW